MRIITRDDTLVIVHGCTGKHSANINEEIFYCKSGCIFVAAVFETRKMCLNLLLSVTRPCHFALTALVMYRESSLVPDFLLYDFILKSLWTSHICLSFRLPILDSLQYSVFWHAS